MEAGAVTLEREGYGTVLSPVTPSHDEEHTHWGLWPLLSFPQNAVLQSMKGNSEWLGRIKPAIVSVLVED